MSEENETNDAQVEPTADVDMTKEDSPEQAVTPVEEAASVASADSEGIEEVKDVAEEAKQDSTESAPATTEAPAVAPAIATPTQEPEKEAEAVADVPEKVHGYIRKESGVIDYNAIEGIDANAKLYLKSIDEVLNDYATKMSKRVTQRIDQIIAQQRQLYWSYMAALGSPPHIRQYAMDLLLSYFTAFSNDAFETYRIGRNLKDMNMPADQLKAFEALTSTFLVAHDPVSRFRVATQVDLQKVASFLKNQAHRMALALHFSPQ